MTLSRKDHFVIAASQLVKKPEFYVGKQETKDSFKRYKEEVEHVALELMKIGQPINDNSKLFCNEEVQWALRQVCSDSFGEYPLTKHESFAVEILKFVASKALINQ